MHATLALIVALAATVLSAPVEIDTNTNILKHKHNHKHGEVSEKSLRFSSSDREDCGGKIYYKDHVLDHGECWNRKNVFPFGLIYTTTPQAVKAGCQIVFYKKEDCEGKVCLNSIELLYFVLILGCRKSIASRLIRARICAILHLMALARSGLWGLSAKETSRSNAVL